MLSMNPVVYQIIGAAFNIATPTDIPKDKLPWVTMSELKRTLGACGDGQRDVANGFKAYYGIPLDDDRRLSLGECEICSPNYGLYWVWSRKSDFREDDSRRVVQMAIATIARILQQEFPDKFTLSAEELGQFLAINKDYVEKKISRTVARDKYKRLIEKVPGQQKTYSGQVFLDGVDGEPYFLRSFLANFLDFTDKEARHLMGAVLMKITGEHYEIPAVTVAQGGSVKIAGVLYDVVMVDGRASLVLRPYRSPAAGERWKDAADKKYLILAGEQQAVCLSDGSLHPLTDGALPNTERGVTFFYEQGKAA